MKITIGHIYPQQLNLYGDSGNVECLVKRCVWRDIEVEVIPIEIGIPAPPIDEIDILFMGGGEDVAQKNIYNDFVTSKKDFISSYINQKKSALFICGGFQLLGKYYQPYSGASIPGLNIIDMYTRHFGRDKKRCVGNVCCETETIMGLERNTLVGFENHGGRTYLDSNIKALGKIKMGYGNNGDDLSEGVIFKNCLGTYLHGPFLPKNPHIADFLIGNALKNKYKKEVDLPPLDDELEWQAHDNALKLSN